MCEHIAGDVGPAGPPGNYNNFTAKLTFTRLRDFDNQS